jgi:hypothetical protein
MIVLRIFFACIILYPCALVSALIYFATGKGWKTPKFWDFIV